MGQVRSAAGPGPDGSPLPQPERSHGDVEKPVTGMRARTEVVWPAPLRIHHDLETALPQAVAEDCMSDEEVLLAVAQDDAEINRDADHLSRTGVPHMLPAPSERAEKVSAPEYEHRWIHSPRSRRRQVACCLVIGKHLDRVSGRVHGDAVLAAGRDHGSAVS